MNPKRLFWILFSLNLFNYIDRQVLFSVFPLIQTDLHITDFQLGTLASVFMIVYMCYAPVVGFFADRHPRQYWIAASAFLWSVATFLSGLAKNYASLITARSIIGIGEGGFTTIAQPFLAEQYPKNKRATILAYFGLALPAGAALGYLFGGVIGASWLPSYGPEMRGGTANCSVVVSDGEVFTPIVSVPDTVIIMNEPSLPKFEPLLKKGGLMIINSSLINSRPTRTDITAVCVPCNEIAEQVGSARVANLVALGAFCKLTGAVEVEGIVHAMKKVFKRAKPEMLEINKKALQAGFDYVK